VDGDGIIASITPEIPPSVNIVRKPSANSIGVSVLQHAAPQRRQPREDLDAVGTR
jgi:hypothetical protein